jgi:hypothetical protein
MEPLLGRKLGDYDIQDLIHRGAVATIYRGHEPFVNRYVGIAVLASSLAWDNEFVECFAREGRAAALLVHPAIVKIHHVRQEGLSYYYVMEDVESLSLDFVIRPPKMMVVNEVILVLRQISDALDYAHSQGLHHLDVRPENVLIGHGSAIRLHGFGIGAVAFLYKLRNRDVRLETPGYWTPEHISEAEAGPATDLYALAALAYEMLTGRRPLEGRRLARVLSRKAWREPKSVRSLRRDLPPDVDAVLAKALSEDPELRFPSGRAFVTELASALATEIPGDEAVLTLPGTGPLSEDAVIEPVPVDELVVPTEAAVTPDEAAEPEPVPVDEPAVPMEADVPLDEAAEPEPVPVDEMAVPTEADVPPDEAVELQPVPVDEPAITTGAEIPRDGAVLTLPIVGLPEEAPEPEPMHADELAVPTETKTQADEAVSALPVVELPEEAAETGPVPIDELVVPAEVEEGLSADVVSLEEPEVLTEGVEEEETIPLARVETLEQEGPGEQALLVPSGRDALPSDRPPGSFPESDPLDTLVDGVLSFAGQEVVPAEDHVEEPVVADSLTATVDRVLAGAEQEVSPPEGLGVISGDEDSPAEDVLVDTVEEAVPAEGQPEEPADADSLTATVEEMLRRTGEEVARPRSGLEGLLDVGSLAATVEDVEDILGVEGLGLVGEEERRAAIFRKVEEAVQAGRWTEALSLSRQIPDYPGVDDLLRRAGGTWITDRRRTKQYQRLQDAMDDERWGDAIELAAGIPGFEDADKLGSEAKQKREEAYVRLQVAAETDRWDEAVELAKSIPGYRDADALLKQAEGEITTPRKSRILRWAVVGFLVVGALVVLIVTGRALFSLASGPVPTATSTVTRTPRPTGTPAPTDTPTPTPLPTLELTSTPTLPPTATPINPTGTASPTQTPPGPTGTPLPETATPTEVTSTPRPYSTPRPRTATPRPPTATQPPPTATDTVPPPTPTSRPTRTPVTPQPPTATRTPDQPPTVPTVP